MKSNVLSCSAWRLYVIVDRAACGARDPALVASAAIRGGADVIQLRDKTAPESRLFEEASRLLRVTRRAGVPLIINDRVEIALRVGADGVHLGQEDLPIQQARSLLGAGRLIGRSTHSLEQALAAVEAGADYIALGPIYPTPTKPDYGRVGTGLIRRVSARVHVPIVCIGGIDAATVGTVLEARAACVAVVRAVCSAADPEAAARELKRTLEQFRRAPSASRI